MIITIADNKGGVGKTTTAAALAQALEYDNPKTKTLLIDMDAQGSLTKSVCDAPTTRGGIYAAISGTANAEELIEETDAGRIIPYSAGLARLDLEYMNNAGRDYKLLEAIESIEKQFDYIIIDTAPGRGLALNQALTAADSVIIPLLAAPESLEGLNLLFDTIGEVKSYHNRALYLEGLLITRYDGRAVVTRQYEELINDICNRSNINIFKTKIRQNITIQEAHALRENLFTYSPKSKAAADYLALARELKANQKKREKRGRK